MFNSNEAVLREIEKEEEEREQNMKKEVMGHRNKVDYLYFKSDLNQAIITYRLRNTQKTCIE